MTARKRPVHPRQPGLLGDEQRTPVEGPAEPVAATPAEVIPLAERLRPRIPDEFVGQAHLMRASGPIRQLLQERRVVSCVLWGPPGTGKTTLAAMMARACAWPTVWTTAVYLTTPQLRKLFRRAQDLFRTRRIPLVIVVDEVHRLNRAQQALWLPWVERGIVVLVGVTTENPSIALIPPLLSRLYVFRLQPLASEELRQLFQRAWVSLGLEGIPWETDALEAALTWAAGDARRLIQLVEAVGQDVRTRDLPAVDRSVVQQWVAAILPVMDRGGEMFYNLISALQKSIRNSDPDAALYWLARLVLGGADPRYIARRLIRTAVEDIGLTEPRALGMAVDALRAFEQIGSPEGELVLAWVTVFLATAPKSHRVYMAFQEALKTAEATAGEPVPLHLCNPVTSLMEDWGYGKGYQYAHDVEAGVTPMECFPEALQGTRFYHPTARGMERRIRRWLAYIRKHRGPAENPPQ
ncbi:MAG: replication-associated recombination protein A [Acidobacteria bacterium]|nr:replication-associated recombination protein A [Acidobacteriota bacterium]MDW7984670.1 replication-associated recombination protein A [Acidobacteriota bacterium]